MFQAHTFFLSLTTPSIYFALTRVEIFGKIMVRKENEMTTKLNKITSLAIKTGLRGGIALMLALCATFTSVGAMGKGSVSAQTEAVTAETRVAESSRITYNLPGVYSKNLWSHKTLTLRVNGRQISESAAEINGIVYLPLRAYLSSIGQANVSYNSSTRTATATMSGLVISVTDGAFVTYANDRPLFSFSPAVLMSNGRMYVPASALIKATGLKRDSLGSSSVSFSGSYSPLLPASRFYRDDEVLWLSRIISAESRGEPLLGQIAVGNVILNRVKSPLYPNTIWGVIFDRRYGVQFSPVANGTIYNDPPFISVLAAKICLEGVALSDEPLFFHEPNQSTSSWIENNRKYLYTISHHDFYA